MISVLFVCLGNICRSPMAEAVFADLVNKTGLSNQITIDSAGTGGWHTGESAHPGTLKVLRKHDIPYNGRVRQFQHADLSRFNYVLAMDGSNLSTIRRVNEPPIKPGPQITTFLHYANQSGLVKELEVPDPYYNNNFDYVYNLVRKGSQALLAHIRKEHKL